MSSVSPDNAQLTGMVARVRQSHSLFQTTLRGAVTEVLAGLGSGVHNMMTMNRVVDAVVHNYLLSSRAEVMEHLGLLSESALNKSKPKSDVTINESHLAVAEALYRGFAAEIEHSIERAANSDARSAMDFVKTQLIAGRFVATTDELTRDLAFNVKDKAGRHLDSAEYVYREVNWSYRQQYNVIMVHVMLANDVELAVVDGGSKGGAEVNLMNYDVFSPIYFHHNSKSLLQPLD